MVNLNNTKIDRIVKWDSNNQIDNDTNATNDNWSILLIIMVNVNIMVGLSSNNIQNMLLQYTGTWPSLRKWLKQEIPCDYLS
jgi:hypothetical protein